MEQFILNIRDLSDKFRVEAEKALKSNNKAAAARSRKLSRELEKQLKDYRRTSLSIMK